MKGRAKIESALSADGTSQIPAVICYEDIFARDHWRELTDRPWWYRAAPDLNQQLAWRRDVIEAIGQDWLYLPIGPSARERENLSIEVRPEGVLVDLAWILLVPMMPKVTPVGVSISV